MKSIVRDLAIFGLVGTLGCFSLTGCGASSDDTNDQDKEATRQEVTADEEKYFDVGEHLFFERYSITDSADAPDVTGGSVSIPEGYSVYDIENFTRKYGRGSETGGYDVWFINDVPVEVEKVYNEILEIYDYSEPGTPSLDKSGDAVQKVK